MEKEFWIFERLWQHHEISKNFFDIFDIKNVHTTILAITYRTFPPLRDIAVYGFYSRSTLITVLKNRTLVLAMLAASTASFSSIQNEAVSNILILYEESQILFILKFKVNWVPRFYIFFSIISKNTLSEGEPCPGLVDYVMTVSYTHLTLPTKA